MAQRAGARPALPVAAVVATVLVAAVTGTVGAALLLANHRRNDTASTSVPGPPRRAGRGLPYRRTGSATAPGRTRARPPTGVGLARCTMVDESRSTYDYATGTVIPHRTLAVEVRYPTTSRAPADAAGEIPGATPAVRRGGYPAVLFAPGYDVTADAYTRLLDAWVRAGFVVAAPAFPDTNPAAVAAARYGNPENDLVNQPGDVAFVARNVVQAARHPDPACPILHGLVDPRGLALAGQSDGGDTVALLAYGRSGPGTGFAAGLPIRAVAVLSGAAVAGDTYGAAPGSPALLAVQGTGDECNPPQDSTVLYNAIGQGDKWFLTLYGANHLGPYDGDDAAAFQMVAQVTSRFFHLELAGRAPGATLAAVGDARPALARLTAGPAAPELTPLPFAVDACARP